MASNIYAVVEVYSGQYHQGFKTPEDAEKFVHQRLDEIEHGVDYEFRTVQVIAEWSSDQLLPGER